MDHPVLSSTKFPPRSVSLPPHPAPPPLAVPIVQEKASVNASWIPAKSWLHFIAGGSVSRLLYENTRRAERVVLAGWVGCVED
jgi:hypothetical protein